MIEQYYNIEELLYKIEYAIFIVKSNLIEKVKDVERIRDLLSGAEACVIGIKRELIKKGVIDV